MTLIKFIQLWALTTPLLVLLDVLWFGLITKDFYQKQLPGLLRADVYLPPAALFYPLFAAALIVFVISPSLGAGLTKTLLMGAFFGFVAYATFDLTAYALIKNWPLSVTVVDMLWGSFVAMVVSGAGFYIARWLGL